MKNFNFKTILAFSICMLSLVAACGASFAWFASVSVTNENIITGSSEGAYFAYGTGTLDDPYGISNTRHLNNLAWLQYSGEFNKGEHVYFELANDINTNGVTYSTLPIGTEENPFIGVFNGNGHTIHNIKITNNANGFSDKPRSFNDYVATEAEVVGLFGVVGNLDGESYSSSVNSIEDFNLDNITVESTTDETLIGIAAGFVNANMSGVKVGKSTLSVNGNSAKEDYTNKLSDYGLVGYTTKEGSNGTYSQKVSAKYSAGGDGSGGGDEWGGSLNFKDLNNRIYHFLSPKSGTTRTHSDSSNKIKGTATTFSKDPATNQVIYRLINDTIMPLNVDASNNYATKEGNTGYIVAGGTGSSTRTIINSSYPIKYINNSLTNVYKSNDDIYHDRNLPAIAYNPTGENLEILTHNGSNYVRIKDEYNAGHNSTNDAVNSYEKSNDTTPQSLGLQKYDKARASLHNILTKKVGGNLVGEDYIHGLRFLTTGISSGTYVTTPSSGFNVYINGSGPMYSYQLVKNSIDFNLKTQGFINFFAGSYFADSTGATTDSLFSLYQVSRTGKNINNVKEIEDIYLNANYNPQNEDSDKYVYKLKGESKPSSATGDPVFSCSLLTSVPSQNVVYYFEIPVNKGEYAIGLCSKENKKNGAYLFYLDISAGNNVSDEFNAYGVSTYQTGLSFPSGIDFMTTDVTGVAGGETLGIIISPSSTGNVSFDVSGTSITYSSSFTTQYAYSTKTVTSDSPPSAAVTPPTNGTREVVTNLKTTDGHTWDIIIEDVLDSDNNVTSWSYKSIILDGEVASSSDIPESFTNELSSIRSTVKIYVVTLIRESGSDEFKAHPTYSGTNNTTVAISLDAGTSTISVQNKAAGYNISINGTPVTTDPFIYPTA